MTAEIPTAEIPTAEIPTAEIPTAVPLPEEQRSGVRDAVDGRGAAEEVLRESEERIAEVTQAEAPGDVADEHRRSAETVDS